MAVGTLENLYNQLIRHFLKSLAAQRMTYEQTLAHVKSLSLYIKVVYQI